MSKEDQPASLPPTEAVSSDDVPREIRTSSPTSQDEHRHIIGGKRFSITPLQSNLSLDIDEHSIGSLSVSEEGEHEHDEEEEEGESSPRGSVKGNLTDEESYVVSTSGSEDEEDTKGSTKKGHLPFSTYAPSPSHSDANASFDVTEDVTNLSPSSVQRYAAKTPKMKEVKKKKRERRKQRKAQQRMGVKIDAEKKGKAANFMKGILLIRRARLLARFLRANPDLKGSEREIVKIQALLRGNSDRKMLKVQNGDYVPNAGLMVLKGQHGGEKGLCEYVRRMEEENRQLLLDIANVSAMNLLTGPAGSRKKEEEGMGGNLRPPTENLRGNTKGKKQRWILYKLDEDTGAYAEVKLGYAGLRRLDVIASQNSVRKIEREESKRELEKRRERERIEKEHERREEEEGERKKEISPKEEVEEIEGRRGIEGDIEVEKEEEAEGGEEQNEETQKGSEAAESAPESEPEPEPEPEFSLDPSGSPDPSPEDSPEISTPMPQAPAPIAKEEKEEVDIVLQWRQSRGYGLGGDSSSFSKKKKKKKKNATSRF